MTHLEDEILALADRLDGLEADTLTLARKTTEGFDSIAESLIAILNRIAELEKTVNRITQAVGS